MTLEQMRARAAELAARMQQGVATDDERAEARSLVEQIQARQADADLAAQLAAAAPQVAATPAARAAEPTKVEARSTGAAFVQRSEYKDWASRSDLNGRVRVEDVRAAGPFVTSNLGGLVQPQRDGLIPTIEVPLGVASLFRQDTTDASAISYVKRLPRDNSAGAYARTAAETPEGGLKPATSFALSDEIIAPMVVVATWLETTRQALRNGDQVREMIDGELTYDVEDRIDSQLLYGTGTGGTLRGLDHSADGLAAEFDIVRYRPSAGSTDSTLITLRKAQTEVELSGMAPDGIVIHPRDWQNVELDLDDTGEFRFTQDPSQAQAKTAWGLRVVSTVRVAEGSSYVGAFKRAGTVWYRGGLTIEVGTINDQLVRNQATVLAEREVAFQVRYPKAIVKVTFAAAAS